MDYLEEAIREVTEEVERRDEEIRRQERLNAKSSKKRYHQAATYSDANDKVKINVFFNFPQKGFYLEFKESLEELTSVINYKYVNIVSLAAMERNKRYFGYADQWVDKNEETPKHGTEVKLTDVFNKIYNYKKEKYMREVTDEMMKISKRGVSLRRGTIKKMMATLPKGKNTLTLHRPGSFSEGDVDAEIVSCVEDFVLKWMDFHGHDSCNEISSYCPVFGEHLSVGCDFREKSDEREEKQHLEEVKEQMWKSFDCNVLILSSPVKDYYLTEFLNYVFLEKYYKRVKFILIVNDGLVSELLKRDISNMRIPYFFVTPVQLEVVLHDFNQGISVTVDEFIAKVIKAAWSS